MLTDILGQESVIASLKESLRRDELPQTYLFAGDHQIGKTTTAFALAKALLCTNRQSGRDDSCDVCSACKTVTSNTHPDLRSTAPSGPSRVLRMAQFWPRDGVKDHPADRAMLRDLHYSPVGGKKRIFIIECAEAMNEDTANSLLKVLEEPPLYALFILTAVSTEAVLPTIFSRSQSLRFRPVPQGVISSALVNNGVAQNRADFLAAYAQGRPGIAFRASKSVGGLAARDEILEIAAESSRGRPLITAFRIADDLRKASSKLTEGLGSDEESSPRTLLTAACDVLLYWYRDLLVRASTRHVGKVFNVDRLDEIDKLAKRYTVDELEHAINLITDTRRYIGRNANAQVATEYLMFNLVTLGRRAAA